jgi:hypothetical protein
MNFIDYLLLVWCTKVTLCLIRHNKTTFFIVKFICFYYQTGNELRQCTFYPPNNYKQFGFINILLRFLHYFFIFWFEFTNDYTVEWFIWTSHVLSYNLVISDK